MGISISDKQTDWIQDIVVYSKSGKSEVISSGMSFGSTTAFSEMVCEDRHIGKQLLSDAGVSVPHGIVFKLDSEDFDVEELRKIAGSFMEEGKTYVCRPAYGTGNSAQSNNVKNLDELELHLDQYIEDFATWLLEEAHAGSRLTVLVIGSKIAGAIVRKEFGLMGDGNSSLEELIDAYNEDAAEENQIEINAETRQWMREQSIYLSDIVPTGQRVILAGGDQGGEIEDVLAELHPDYADWAEKIANVLKRPVFALEISSSAPQDPPSDHAIVMDIDGQVDWSQFKQDDEENELASRILAHLFE